MWRNRSLIDGILYRISHFDQYSVWAIRELDGHRRAAIRIIQQSHLALLRRYSQWIELLLFSRCYSSWLRGCHIHSHDFQCLGCRDEFRPAEEANFASWHMAVALRAGGIHPTCEGATPA